MESRLRGTLENLTYLEKKFMEKSDLQKEVEKCNIIIAYLSEKISKYQTMPLGENENLFCYLEILKEMIEETELHWEELMKELYPSPNIR